MDFFEVYKTKRDRAMKVLEKLGAIKFFDDAELYHGRAGDGSPWEVKSQFDNAGNNTGNANIIEIPGLYIAHKEDAERFAQARTGDGQTPEVHKIVSLENELAVVDLRFSYGKLSDAQKKEYNKALKTLDNLPITSGVAVKFEYRDIFHYIRDAIEEISLKDKTGFLTEEQIESVVDKLSLNQEIRNTLSGMKELKALVCKFAGARNAKIWLKVSIDSAIWYYTDNSNAIVDGKTYPLNAEYISAWCEKNGIIGSVTDISSATLNRRINDVYHIFNMSKIATESQRAAIQQKRTAKFGGLPTILGKVSSNADINAFLKSADPSEIMKYISQNEQCKELFALDSGVWERWTVGQHTHAVLSFFEDNYKTDVPEQLTPIIKVMLLSHDIGKGIAVKKRLIQSRANAKCLPVILDALEIDANIKKIIELLICQEYTSNVVVGKDKVSNMKKLSADIIKLYKELYKQQPKEEDVEAFIQLAIVLQTCDSGAYTRYGRIRDERGCVTSGGNDRFTASFTTKEGKPRLWAFDLDV